MSTHLMAVLDDGNDAESEPVLVDHEDGNVVVLNLDDGRQLRFDRTELAAAIHDDRSQAA